MPIYEYLCDHCEERFELLVRRASETDGSSPPCPSCGQSDTRRVLSGFALTGQPRADPREIQARRSAAERAASITPREQIDKWRAARKTDNP